MANEPAAPTSSAYLGLARKWRPSRFEDLVGQDAVGQSLSRALDGNRLVHGHLLAGPRGVGKTTSARILARAVNCAKGPTATPCGECRHCLDIAAGNDLDVIEIDAASNTGVDNMRELLEGTVRAPFSARFKVYIIDEVHMLSMGAFNALLKTLEEPPDHVMFIFATTELEKIPETIRSRCIVHRFRRLAGEDIVRRLQEVARGEGVELDDESGREIFELIAQAVDGGMRDALVAFDQLLSLTHGKPTVEAARDLLGLSSQALLCQSLEAVAANDAAGLLGIVEGLVSQGRSLERYVKGLIGYTHSIMVLQAVPGQKPHSMSGEILERTEKLAAELSPVTVFNLMNQLLELEERLKLSAQPRFLVEFTFLRLVAVRPVVPLDEIMNRIQALPATAEGLQAAPAGNPHPTSASADKPAPYRREAEPAPAVRETPSVPQAPAPRARPAALAGAGSMTMHDSSSGEVGDSVDSDKQPGAIMAGGSLAALTRDELIDLILPILPETHKFLGRYLKTSTDLSVREGTLWIEWPKNDRVASKMFAKGENREALERVLLHLAGRALRVESTFGDREAVRPKAPAAAASLSIAAPARFSDSAPSPAQTPSAIPGMESRELPASPDASARPSAIPVMPRVTADETRALLTDNEEFARRARMVRDFFEGTFVDHAGKPIPT